MSELAVGRLSGTFGIRGELKLQPTPVGEDAFAAGRRYSYVTRDGSRGELTCTTVRRHHDRLVIAFDGYETPEAGATLVGAVLSAERDEIALGPGEFFDADLVGLRLVDASGRELARVTGVEHYPAQDCLIVEPGARLVPMVRAFVGRIDLEAGTIETTLPPGLLSDDDAD